MGIIARSDKEGTSDKASIRIIGGRRPQCKSALSFSDRYIKPVMGVLDFHQSHFPVSRKIDGIGQAARKLC